MGIRASYIPITPEQLERAKKDLAEAEQLQEHVPYEEWGDIQKAWSSLWWLLDPARRHPDYRGDAQPSTLLGRAVMGARILNPEFSANHEEFADGGVWGCTRYLNAEETSRAADALDALSTEELVAAFSSEEMTGEARRALGNLDWLDKLRVFYRRAADEGKAVAVIID